MKKLLALFVMSGAVLGGLVFLTQHSTVGVRRALSGLTLTHGEVVKEGALV